jgi:hypothetical protein
MADHKIPCAATATVAYPEDFLRKMEKAKRFGGSDLSTSSPHALQTGGSLGVLQEHPPF